MAYEKHDGLNWMAFAHVDKYSPEQVAWATARLGHEPDGTELRALFAQPEDGVTESKGNILVTVGLARITSLITGAGGGAFTNTGGWVAVGDSSTSESAGDTDLNAVTNKYYKTLDATYPTTSNGLITAQTTYGTSVANFAWNEWAWGCVNSGSATSATSKASTGTSAIILNHKTATLGTKASGASWVFTTTVTLS
jgi:hypothetical protein